MSARNPEMRAEIVLLRKCRSAQSWLLAFCAHGEKKRNNARFSGTLGFMNAAVSVLAEARRRASA